MKKWEVVKTAFSDTYCLWTINEGEQQMCMSGTVRRPDLGIIDWIQGDPKEVQARIELIAAAVNACKEINPENPAAAAAAMPDIFRLLLAAAADAQKICGKRLDPKEWLEKTDAALDKAMKEAA